MIPKTFIRKYGENLSSLTFLKLPNGAKWKVELTYYLWSMDAALEVPHPCLTRRELPARSAVSRRVITRGFFFFKPTRADAAPTWADSRWIGPTRAWISRNGRFRPKLKKKKMVQNTPFELNLKPSFSSLHTNTPNFLY